MEALDQWWMLVLFVPLAALAGWIIGRRGGERHSDSQVSKLSTTYFRGLNYLLNEQPDKAIELFLHIAELDKDTFETQVALGHLFRRRGEVDRAIRLHQALAQRPELTDAQKVQALSALGEDYMRSGLLDRAETVFADLARIDQRAPQALRHLIAIYQSERDWEKAIENDSRFEAATGLSYQQGLFLFASCVLLYTVIGNEAVASHLRIPVNRDGANWAIMAFLMVGCIAGYLWYNAPPSQVLMGDAGSRPIGLLIGMLVVATNNPLFLLLIGSVLLLNGATGLVKVALARFFGLKVLSRVRFPLHDHCRKELGWTNSQVLVRFMLLQIGVSALLVLLALKLR